MHKLSVKIKHENYCKLFPKEWSLEILAIIFLPDVKNPESWNCKFSFYLLICIEFIDKLY